MHHDGAEMIAVLLCIKVAKGFISSIVTVIHTACCVLMITFHRIIVTIPGIADYQWMPCSVSKVAEHKLVTAGTNGMTFVKVL